MLSFLSRFRKPANFNDRIAGYIRKQFGYAPRDTQLYEQALRHSSAVKRGAKGVSASNERLEFLGDAVLDVIVAEYLYRAHEEMPEGELTKMKAKVVSRKMLNQVGMQLEIQKQLHAKLGRQQINRAMVGNALEALIGAIYLDKGYSFTSQKVLELLHKNDIETKVHDTTDFKSKLHEWCQKERKSLTFEIIRENAVAEALDRYEIVVFVEGEALGRGKGKSKKGAEQQASSEACRILFDD